MKKGISVWAFPAGVSLGEIFSQAKALGFDGVEVALDETGELSVDSTQGDLDRIRDAARETGIELYSVATGLYWKYSLTDNDPAVRDKAMKIAKRQIEAAAYLGCDTVLVVPGLVSGSVPYDAAYERALDAAKELAPFAEERGVFVGLENVWNDFLLSPLETRDFLDRIGSPNICSYFDAGNVLRTGYPEQWIRILGNRIKKVHVKDFKGSVGTIEGFCDLLAGDVDFGRVMEALQEVGYDGWITAEVSPYSEGNDVMLRHTSNALNIIFGR